PANRPWTPTVSRVCIADTTPTATYPPLPYTTLFRSKADASYAGDANHTGSNATQVSFSITPAGSTTTISCAPGSFTYTGSAITPCTESGRRNCSAEATSSVTSPTNTKACTNTAKAEA